MTESCGDAEVAEPPTEDAAVATSQEQQQQQPTTTESPDQQQQQQQQHPASPLHQMEHFVRIKALVKSAIEAKHTFTIYGRSRIIRDCLLGRGWCEKLPRKLPGPADSSQHFPAGQIGVDSNPSALLTGIGNLADKQNERLLISKMLQNHTVDFVWNAGSEWNGWPAQDNKSTIFNRFTRANFTSKVGLCSNVRQMHWYYEPGIANTLFPRCYNLSQPDQMHSFLEDFRLTACLSLLKWLVDKLSGNSASEESVRSANGIVPLRALEFAIGRCSDFIGSKSHEDIDQEAEKVWSHQWDQFIAWYYKLVHGNALFISSNVPIQKYLLAARHLLKKVKKFWPQYEMDGYLNIWILKPGNKSRGRGIVLMNKLDDILAKVNPSNKTNDTRFVVQKYIERPLLIYDTKFDIRQWFIVTCAQPLTLWMYRESYLRFCSQKFSLVDFHESIHLSNNAVQCKYKNSPDRDARLPTDNMWDATTFKEFLKCRGDGNAWDELIYPGMKQSLVGSLLASQEAMDRRKNSFELYGADFMVMEDFSVWLIEINSHPDMSNSTSVTTRLCRKALEDTIKVVVDYREDPNAETGEFELVYRQKLSFSQGHLGTGLSLHGTRIAPEEKRASTAATAGSTTTAPWLRKNKITSTGVPSAVAAAHRDLAKAACSQGLGPALVDLLEELEIQLDHEFYEYMKLRSSNGTLNRQTLPLPAANLPRLQVDPNLSNSKVDVQTNTVPRNINWLAPTNTNPAAVPTTDFLPTSTSAHIHGHQVTEKSSKNSATSSGTKRNTFKQRASAHQKSGNLPQLTEETTLKLTDSRKHKKKSNSAIAIKTARSYLNAKATMENSVTNSKTTDPENGSLSKKKKKSGKNSANKSPSQNASNDEKIKRKGYLQPLQDKKAQSTKKTAKGTNKDIFLDVTEMYAVGLAVNGK